MMKSDFWWSVSRLPHTHRYVHEYLCELLGSIILSVCWVWVCNFFGHYPGGYITMVNSKFPLPSLNREQYRVLW